MKSEKMYVIWQNLSIRWYIASKILWQDQLHIPSVFCGQQAIEILIKATLIYYVKNFKPEKLKHNFKKLINTLRNQVKKAKYFDVPKYFYEDYYTRTRYPKGLGIVFSGNFLKNLDKTFFELIAFVPQHKFITSLKQILDKKDGVFYDVIKYDNKKFQELENLFKITILIN